MKTSFPKDRIKVVLFENPHGRADEVLADEGFQVQRVDATDDQRIAEALHDAHLVGIRSRTHLTDAILEQAPRLLAVACLCIGTNQVDLDAARRRGIPVFNSPFSNTRSVAELTIAEIVCLHRRLFERSAQMHAGRWNKSAAGAHEIRGRTLGIVGYGRIGSQVSVLAEAMGMRVLYHDLAPALALGNAERAASLDDLLDRADVVTLHVPATNGTKHLIGARQIARMKPGSFLINNARGGVVDLEALADALRTGHLAGAALDVFPAEPGSNSEPFDSPVRGIESVILSPHIGGSTVEAQRAIAEDAATKLVRFVNIGSTTGAVNVPEVELPSQELATAPPGDSPRPHRILHFHRNVPGVMSTLHKLISDLGANVSGEYLRTREDLGYVVLDVDPTDGEALAAALRSVPETVRTRVLW